MTTGEGLIQKPPLVNKRLPLTWAHIVSCYIGKILFPGQWFRLKCSLQRGANADCWARVAGGHGAGVRPACPSALLWGSCHPARPHRSLRAYLRHSNIQRCSYIKEAVRQDEVDTFSPSPFCRILQHFVRCPVPRRGTEPLASGWPSPWSRGRFRERCAARSGRARGGSPDTPAAQHPEQSAALSPKTPSARQSHPIVLSPLQVLHFPARAMCSLAGDNQYTPGPLSYKMPTYLKRGWRYRPSDLFWLC